jgi:hypothetical protein
MTSPLSRSFSATNVFSSQVCRIHLRVPTAFSHLRNLAILVDAGAEWLCGTRQGQPNSQGTTFLEAIKEQLGLKLESTKAPLKVLVIDHVERPVESSTRLCIRCCVGSWILGSSRCFPSRSFKTGFPVTCSCLPPRPGNLPEALRLKGPMIRVSTCPDKELPVAEHRFPSYAS